MADLKTAKSSSEPSTAKERQTISFMSTSSFGSRHVDHASPQVRFNVSLLVLASMGVIVVLIQYLFYCDSAFTTLVGTLTALFIAFFGYEWVWVHSNALTRHRRAHFDEANILETYQPRARTLGHLFQPDPPTPGMVTIKDGDAPERTESEKAAFNAVRDSHYANMFQHAMQVAKEQEAMEKQPQTSSGSQSESSSTATAKPAENQQYENIDNMPDIAKIPPPPDGEKKL
ncbi:unnamed protein product [Bursaphelenchus xylophilus]|uniref:(pine wood nematode) hypothetical protein n=1 Tax=Bursaphelenchus xylophilus TaxID=6326 RepID=A0A1I7SA34_BURXY|nr:unnamed protein product [Bursaphelenchus xylophilus]CAG9131789.1 unnamed protein product [Bursaphelenchus xylophilus]